MNPPPCTWCPGGPGPCWCLSDCRSRARGGSAARSCPQRPGNTEWPAQAWPLPPAWTAIWRALPFLDLIPPGLIGIAPRTWDAAAQGRVAAGHDCVLCGRGAIIAIAATAFFGPDQWPRWADLCGPCYGTVRRESDQLAADGYMTS